MDREQIKRDSSLLALHSGISGIRDGVSLCAAKPLLLPTLVLIYSAIDTLASLNRPAAHDYVTRKDFIAWVEQYLLPARHLPASSLDLYAARCSILHTAGHRSKLAEDGKAKRLMYAWGRAVAADIQEEAGRQNRPDLVAIHLDDLKEGLFLGMDAWLQAVAADPILLALVVSRSNELYVPLGIEVFEEYKKRRG